MELLDVGLTEVTSAIAYISQVVCPPFETVSMNLQLSLGVVLVYLH